MSVMNFNQYIGGSDGIKIETIFPSTQKTYLYNFAQDVAGWTFHLDYQTLVIDYIQYDRETGEPNFAKSGVAGYFPAQDIDQLTYVSVVDAATGAVAITIPGGLYQGNVNPDARNLVPITIVGVSWTDANMPPQTNTHRWAFIQTWEPGVPTGSPTDSTGFTEV